VIHGQALTAVLALSWNRGPVVAIGVYTVPKQDVKVYIEIEG